MPSLMPPLFRTPWTMIRFFMPVTALIPAAAYYLTVFAQVFPGFSAALTASAAGLCAQEDLSYPLFSLAARGVAGLAGLTLPLRLNLFCAGCGAVAVALFYLLAARLVFIFACEDPGGSMAALPPQARETEEDDEPRLDAGFAMNADGSLSMPVSVQAHNRRVARAAVLGGLGAASVLAFCAPFWLVATRLYPFTFDLMLAFLIINLMISYDQSGRLSMFFLSLFLLAACSVESPLFLLLFPVGLLFLLRALTLNGQATTYKVLFALLTLLAGGLAAAWLLWDAAAHCAAIPVPAPRPILLVFKATVFRELVRWIPSYGWSYTFVQLLFPAAIAFFVFSNAFRRRTPVHFLLQLALIVPLIPSLLNLSICPWAIARMTTRIPVFSYVVIALLTGLMIAAWNLMREMYEEKIDDDLDYYEYRDNPVVCRIGSLLCWPLLALALAVPVRSFTEVASKEGAFADAVTEEIYAELGPRDWLVNCRQLQHHLMIRANRDGRRLHFLSVGSDDELAGHAQLSADIRSDPSFEPYRNRLMNAADLSTSMFFREWLRHETNAYRRIVLFDTPSLWRANGFAAVPTGLFLSGAPPGEPLDTEALLAAHHAFTARLQPLLAGAQTGTLPLFESIRKTLRRRLALMANEFGYLLARQERLQEAAALFQQTERTAPDNLSLLLNRYQLALNQATGAPSIPELEARLRAVPQRINTFLLDAGKLQAESGTLINPDILEYARKNFWGKSTSFRNLTITSKGARQDPLTAVRDKKRELYQTITKHVDAYEFEDAERQLNMLLDIDDKDRFALINKARIAIERRDLPEAGLWMDLAKENGATPAELVWHEAALMILNGKLDEARAFINQAIPSATGDIRLWGLLADILLRQNEYAELENRVYPSMRSAANKAEHYLTHMVRGYILKHNGPKDFQNARACFLRALALNRHLTNVREELLRIDDVLDVPAFCEEDAKEVLRQDPEHAFANFLWGMVRLRRGELDMAEDLFMRSLDKERAAPAYAGLGGVMLEKGRLDAAEKLLRHSLELDSTRLFTWHTLARLLLATGRVEEAARALDTVLAAQPEDLDVRLTYIRILIKQSKLEEAASLVSDLLENEDQLPPTIQSQLKPLADQLSVALSK